MKEVNNDLWGEIEILINKSSKEIRVNLSKYTNGIEDINKLKISTKSVLGSVIYNTSGIVIDNWIRILGSSNDEFRGVTSYNKVNSDGVANNIAGLLIIADDIVGGVFAINAGKFSDGIGEVWYFAPDTLEWESLEMKYSEFIAWTITGNTDKFYNTFRWIGWREISKKVKLNEGILIYPYLWSNEINIETASKKIVPIDEISNLNFEYSRKFKLS